MDTRQRQIFECLSSTKIPSPTILVKWHNLQGHVSTIKTYSPIKRGLEVSFGGYAQRY